MAISLTIREYDILSGEIIRTNDSFDFGILSSGNPGEVKVFDFVLSGVRDATKLSISITDSSGIEISPKDSVVTENVSDKGNFGVDFSSSFVSKSSLDKFFSDVNLPISVGFRKENVSNFIYLNVSPSTSVMINKKVSYSISFESSFYEIPHSSSSSLSSSSSSLSSSCSSFSHSCSSSSSSCHSMSCSSSSSSSCSQSSSSCSSSSRSDSFCCIGKDVPDLPSWGPAGVYLDPSDACLAYGGNAIGQFVFESVTYFCRRNGLFYWNLDYYDINGCHWICSVTNGESIAVATVYIGASVCSYEIVNVPYTVISDYNCNSSSSSSSLSSSSGSSSSSSFSCSSSCSSMSELFYCYGEIAYQNKGSGWGRLYGINGCLSTREVNNINGGLVDSWTCDRLSDGSSMARLVHIYLSSLCSDPFCSDYFSGFDPSVPFDYHCYGSSSSSSNTHSSSSSSSLSSLSSSSSFSSSSESLSLDSICDFYTFEQSGNYHNKEPHQVYKKTNILYNGNPTWRGMDRDSWWIVRCFYGSSEKWIIIQCGDYPTCYGEIIGKTDGSRSLIGEYSNPYASGRLFCSGMYLSSSSCSSSSHLTQEGIIVLGAGFNDVNQVYRRSGVWEGAPLYISEDSLFCLLRYNSYQWRIMDYPSKTRSYYFSEYVNSTTPPRDFGWAVLNGISPAPSSHVIDCYIGYSSSSCSSSSTDINYLRSKCNKGDFSVFDGDRGWFPSNASEDFSRMCENPTSSVGYFYWPSIFKNGEMVKWYVDGDILWKFLYYKTQDICYYTTDDNAYGSGLLAEIFIKESASGYVCDSMFSVTPSPVLYPFSCPSFSSSSSSVSANDFVSYRVFVWDNASDVPDYAYGVDFVRIDSNSYMKIGNDQDHTLPYYNWNYEKICIEDECYCLFGGNFPYGFNLPPLPSQYGCNVMSDFSSSSSSSSSTP